MGRFALGLFTCNKSLIKPIRFKRSGKLNEFDVYN